ncbi:hypothetical protein UFOVP181_276 [uncultured Caudovirales phage]|uniref:Uncharacterized protein n=1 Tax=uncultured Caudovirales phage TaxID=2100421 RepID=A0A6J7WH56_9CAUD|nr:hypothetical protein UFOVP57_363 [uncultured Caudovirales phage]CAB5208984.1 hypothetical protein UFOVP181_276 [uncultured Caudovirales phage]
MDYRSLVNKLEDLSKPVDTVVVEASPAIDDAPEYIQTHGIAQELTESFGYQYIYEAEVGQVVTFGGEKYKWLGAQWQNLKTGKVAEKGIKAHLDKLSLEPSPEKTKTHVNPNTTGIAEPTSIAGKAWKNVKRLGSKAALPLAAATEIYDGYQKIVALPKNLPEQQYRSEVSKIVTKLVTHFGIFWVGMVIGGIIGGSIGTVGGPVAIVSGFAGAIAGGIGLEWLTGGTADKLIDLIVNKLYHTQNISKPKQAAQPATPAATKPTTTGPAAPQDDRTDLEKYYDNLGK